MDDSKAKDEWRTSSGGVVYATGSDGTITGYGAGKLRPGFGGCVLIDDPHKAGEAESELRRSNVINWFQTTIESRLNSPDTPIIVVMQRLHEEDLSGWLLAGNNGEQWEHLAIPIMDEDDKPLWPSKHSFDTLERMRQASPYVFAGQYMQSPAPRDGGMIKRDWLAHNRFIMPPATPLRIVQSWDTAFKSADINDPSVCTTWAETPAGYYLLDVFVVRGDYPTVKRCIINKYEQLKPSTVLIEDKASGQSLIQDLRTSTRIPIIAISPVADKISRMYTASAAFESGRVFLPEVADWLMAYEAELFVFPKSKHDDQVDSTSQFINWVNRGYNSAPAARAPQRNWG
jgi:predicted phage terminase large subunit-like protein